jgi:hypothetical protein
VKVANLQLIMAGVLAAAAVVVLVRLFGVRRTKSAGVSHGTLGIIADFGAETSLMCCAVGLKVKGNFILYFL